MGQVRVIPVALAVALSVLLAGTPSLAEGPDVGKELPRFFLSTLNPGACKSRRVVLSNLLERDSTKALLLVFFDADCEPCQKLLPLLGNLYERHAKAGLVVVGVDCDSKREKIEQVKKTIEKMKISFPVVADRFLALARRYGIESFPTIFMANGSGKLVLRQEGYHPEKKPLPLGKIKELLGLAGGDH